MASSRLSPHACRRGLALATVLAASCGRPGAPRSTVAAEPAEADPGPVAAVPSPAPSPQLVHFLGRFDMRDPRGPRFAWPASAIGATFTGTGIDVRLRDAGHNYFAVAVDGGAPSVLSTDAARDRYSLASDLPRGTHAVTITKRTESNVGVVQFLGWAPHDGDLVPSSDPWPARRIEFIGDSITCGYGDLEPDPSAHFRPSTEDETIAYGALAAAALGAAHTAIAYSGQGVYRSHTGVTTDPMPVRWLRTLADDPSAAWAFGAAPPDVVVIHLGTNDFAQGDPGAPFEAAYAGLVRAVRARYPGARIVCALSSSLTDAYPSGGMRRSTAAARIRAVVDRLRPGDEGVSYFEFAEQRLEEGFGADYHPSARTHRRLAQELTAYLRTLMHW